ncbi:hypothetical protein BC30090_p406 (plasmid) [Bacillus cereus]|uniref:hypothetical protein n=3 Tax=Bacillus TaxID=1386 RepID=UPI0013D24694|nr:MULTISPECIES: hypothetical protein [Bacillus cereus group]NEL01369.1 hypothetical protein [Bacillus mobilis]BCD26933.1 hypothetical protein BC30090_p406 [Bacillus cereus]
MKIWKLKKIERDLIEVINLVHKQSGTLAFFDELKSKVMFNKHINDEEFAVLYYSSVFMYNMAIKREPDIVIAPMTHTKLLDKYENLGAKSAVFQQLIQNLYITLALTKENGKEFCEGSSAFSENEYKERQQLLESELGNLKEVASQFIDGLSGTVEIQSINK